MAFAVDLKRFAIGLVALLGALICAGLLQASPAAAAGPCGPPVTNPIACENSKPGDPPSDWQVSGVGDSTIQGFATQMSVNVGDTAYFKIKTPARSYHIDILRLGYYGGDGARIIQAGIRPTATLPQTQPTCLTDSSSGLIDCGNWGVSASWTVPSTAVSGVYIAHLVRDDTGGDSQIVFVVRNDSSHSDILLQTSDAAWEAYNAYGGNSLYTCTVACPPGNPLAYKAAYKVSYNRPFDGAALDQGRSWLYYTEYPMIRWLEANGYDVSYTSAANVDSQGPLLQNHKIFISSGHDEYWSAGQRANVQAARDAGVNLAFFSGNEMFWKTRWEPSTDGSSTPYRTLVTYKETHFTSPVDPKDPTTWTGSWRDPRFSPPADGGLPENQLTGQYFLVNAGTADITVPAQYSKLRLWRNTGVSKLTAGQSLTLGAGDGTLGYEWDVDADNGFRPPGTFDLSSTTVNGVQVFTDYGSTTNTGNATHHLTEYRAPSGALVFGAGTVQWAWGLDNTNANDNGATDPSGHPPDPNMEQATVNLLADMGAQPYALMSGLAPATQSTDSTPPTSVITSPARGANIQDGSTVTITGTATDAGGGVVAGVEVSTDGGTTWHPASGTANWTYTWVAHGNPTANLMSRAADDSGNLESPAGGSVVNVNCACSIWGSGSTPSTADSGDGNSVEVGVKFESDVFGTVTGVRFYKASTNTGTHIGSLWTSSGQQLAQATFTGETASGWQTVTFSQPVAITPGVTYVAGYFAPNGHYSASAGHFYPPPSEGPVLGGVDSPPLHALRNAGGTVNGLFSYTGSSAFPTSTFDATNYWVDVNFTVAPPPGQATNVSATAGYGSANVNWNAPTSGGPVTTYTITPYIGSQAQHRTTVTGSPPVTQATITGLTPGTTYTFTVQASNPNGAAADSPPSNAVTPQATTPPSAPSGVSASAVSSQAVVNWNVPTSDGGSPITGYTITPYIGSTAQTPVKADASATSATINGLTNGTSYTFVVTATNAVGNSPDSSPSNAVTPNDTIFDFGRPGTVDSGDPSSVELGVKFKADTNGLVTGIRFYKAAGNTGPHIGSLWTAGGTLLASATFTNESSSGWQTMLFSTPVSITAGTTYVAGYLAPNGHYSYTAAGLQSAVDNGPLHTIADGSNGVYAYGGSSTFPSNSYNSTNYWVDVIFGASAVGVPGAPSGVSASAVSSQAVVNWNVPTSDGGSPITGYTITPYIGSTAQTPVKADASATSATINGLTNGTSYTFVVTATNAVGNSPDSSPSNAVTPNDTIFDFGRPGTVDSGDPSSVELGVKFKADTNGLVTGIRFYKAAGNTGPHIGSLWTAGGTLLASATFTNESSSGWQTMLFSTPVSITAGTTYVAGYLAPNGHYSYTAAGLQSAVDNGPLHTIADGSNGVYAYGGSSTFPSNSYNSTNYWVDLVFGTQ